MHEQTGERRGDWLLAEIAILAGDHEAAAVYLRRHCDLLERRGVHIFLHELGHHHDRMTTRDKRYTGRGEPYAEEYARRYFDRIWDSYLRAFAHEL